MNLRRDWRDDAACRGKAKRNFDPWDPPGTMYRVPREARTICDSCRVQVECLADALRHNDDGVRGNTTVRQRKALQRPRLRLSCPVCRAGLPEPTLIDDQLTQVCSGCGLSWRTKRPTKRQPKAEPVNTVTDTREETRTSANHDQAIPQPG